MKHSLIDIPVHTVLLLGVMTAALIPLSPVFLVRRVRNAARALLP